MRRASPFESLYFEIDELDLKVLCGHISLRLHPETEPMQQSRQGLACRLSKGLRNELGKRRWFGIDLDHSGAGGECEFGQTSRGVDRARGPNYNK